MIEDRSYGKAELAMLYFPTATPRVALNRLVRWINRCPSSSRASVRATPASSPISIHGNKWQKSSNFWMNHKKSPWKKMHTTHYAYPFQGEFNVITRSKLDFFT